MPKVTRVPSHSGRQGCLIYVGMTVLSSIGICQCCLSILYSSVPLFPFPHFLPLLVALFSFHLASVTGSHHSKHSPLHLLLADLQSVIIWSPYFLVHLIST